jgi:beta-xylosidase
MFKKAIQFFGKGKLTTALLLMIVLVGLVSTVSAANPIINRFIADPAVYVFNNRVYMYNTDDQVNSGSTWDSKAWRAYSSTDLVNWTDEGAFWKVGSGGFTWASNWAWAPSAATKNGYYYIYLPVDANVGGAGVAKIGVIRCTTPVSGCVDPIGGPLIQEGREANTGSEPIDPQIFVDDDGTPYLFFGGMHGLKRVRLNNDMISLNGAITNVTAQGFAESAWIHKRNGTYYLSYSSGWPGPIQYSTSTSINGPWTFRGNILPSQNTNTNHQSPLFYNNRWFLFYQKGMNSGWSNYRRNVAVDCMYYNGDGTIQQVTTTTAGVNSSSCSGAGATYYRITNRNSGKVMDVQQPNTSDGAKIGQYTANGQPWQDWQFVDKGGGYFNIVSRHSGKCLDINGASTADGAGVIQWACGTGNNQQFQWAASGSYFQIKARHSGKCIDVVGSGTADGVLLEQRTCSTANNFLWSR